MPGDDPSEQGPSDQHRQRLLALKPWYDDWATIAGALVKKRSDLITLGLAHRRAAAESEPVVTPAAPGVAATVPTEISSATVPVPGGADA